MTIRSTIELDPSPAKREIKEISEAFDTAAKRQTEAMAILGDLSEKVRAELKDAPTQIGK